VIISATPNPIVEGNDSVVTFTVKPATHPSLTVHYSTSGNATLNTDYTLTGTPGMVAIPANAASASITLHAIADTVSEPNGEGARITVVAGTGYQVPAQPDAQKVLVVITDK
jgi:hypothetical protein